MQVKELMTTDVRTCAPSTTLAEAAAMMLDGDCGILPVVENEKLVGVVTDRDMYIALATRGKLAAEIAVGEVAQSPVYSCGPDDDVRDVLETMRQHRIRRLPVAGFADSVLGIVSLNDVALAAGPRKPIREADVVAALQGICASHHAAPQIVAV